MNSSQDFDLSLLDGIGRVKKIQPRLVAPDSGVQAVLLYGAEGSGKTTIAWSLAADYLSGVERSPKVVSMLVNGTCPDFFNIEPWGPSRLIKQAAIHPQRPGRPKDDEAPDISIQEFLRTPPLMCRKKVVVLEDADRMNRESFNGLLKLLEEPPPYGQFILTTRAISQVATTIVSRCLTLSVELPADAGADDLPGGPASPGVIRRIRASTEIFREIEALAYETAAAPRSAALQLSERLKALSEQLSDAEDIKAREAQSDAVAFFANCLKRAGAGGSGVQAAIEAHKRIIGNANAAMAFDSLFARILAR